MACQDLPTDNDARTALFDAILSLRTREEVEAFLADLCTPSEIRAFAERWEVARLLDAGGKSYREIAERGPRQPHHRGAGGPLPQGNAPSGLPAGARPHQAPPTLR